MKSSIRPTLASSVRASAWAIAISMPVALSLAASATPSMAQTSSAQNQPQGIVAVTGYGEASAKPDQAVLTFAVVGQGEDAKSAVDETSTAISDVIAAMRELGADDRDLQTATFQIFPRYGENNEVRPDRGSSNEIIGYEARNALTVVVREIDKVGAYLDSAIGSGINQGGDVRFEIEDDAELIAEARRLAIKDAKAKADLYSEAAGVSVDRIVSISEPSVNPGRPESGGMRMAAMDSAPKVPIEAGELTRSASIEMVFAIRP